MLTIFFTLIVLMSRIQQSTTGCSPIQNQTPTLS